MLGIAGGIAAFLITVILAGAYEIGFLYPIEATIRCDIWRMGPLNTALGVMWGLYTSRLYRTRTRFSATLQVFSCAIILMASCYWFEGARFVVGFPQKEALKAAMKEAIRADNRTAVKRILDRGLDPNVGSGEEDVQTMVEWASTQNRAECVRLLINYGGDLPGR